MPDEKAKKAYDKAAKDFEMATVSMRLIDAKIMDLNKKIAKGLDSRAMDKTMTTIEKLVKDQHKAGRNQDKAHAAMEKALEALRKEMT